jgi:hypothetical protein
MSRAASVTMCVLAVALSLAALLSSRPAHVGAQPGAARGRCVGISTERTGLQSGVRVYRAFEDGTVEALNDEGNSLGWQKVGK